MKKLDNYKILISSNLNILKTHYAWDDINSKDSTRILEMHEQLFSCASKNYSHELHSIYFFQNIDHKKTSLNNIKQKLKLLIERLKNSEKKTFFYYSFYKKQNLFNDQEDSYKAHSLITNFEKYLLQLSKRYKLFLSLNLDLEFSKFGYDNIFDKRNYYLCRSSNHSKV